MSGEKHNNAAEGERRRHSRMAVHWLGDVTTAGQAVDCTVLDISPGGAKLQSAEPLPALTEVLLKLYHGGQFGGQVAWQHGSFMGIEFVAPDGSA